MLVIVEVILQLVHHVDDPFYSKRNAAQNQYKYIESQFPPDTEFTFESDEGLSYIDSQIHFSTNNYGFRGDDIKEQKGNDEYRIFILGGSTTECLYVDDEKSIESKMQQCLNETYTDKNVNVYNAGKSGDFTTDHIAMLTNRIVQLSPDIVIIFAGVNDLRRVYNGYDFTHSISAPDNKKKNYFWSDLKLLLSHSQIYRHFYNLFHEQSVEAITKSTDYKALVEKTNALPLEEQFSDKSLEPYENNLRVIAGICRSLDIDLIFVTQASTWNSKIDDNAQKWHWMNFILNKRYPQEVMDSKLEEFNDVMKMVANSEDVAVFDLAANIPKSLEYFYDDCHFNNNGAKYFADSLCSTIKFNNFIP